jgi:hypothetical protein
MSVAVANDQRQTLARRRRVRSRGRAHSVPRALELAPWVALGAFLLVEVAISALQLTGPFMDEGIYITAGLRTLQGHGIGDDYLSWFSGSLMWPVIAGLGWKLGGLAGARAAAAICVTIGLVGAVKASGNLFGVRVRAASALAAISSGPVIALGHLAVYDTLAVAAAGCSFWALTEFLHRDDRAWLCAAALLYALAGLAKYPVLLFVGPPLVALIAVTRGRRAQLDLSLFALLVGAVLTCYFLSDRTQLTAFESFRVGENPTFGVTRLQIVYAQVYFTAIPLVLAVAGAMLVQQRRAALALLTGTIGAPLYHLYTGNPSGDQKHAVFGLLFLLPLIGVAIGEALRGTRARLAIPALLVLFVFAAVQVVRIDEGWPDLRASAAVLVQKVRPGERLLANSAWVDAAYLYEHGRIESPYDIYDASRVEHSTAPIDVCSFQWFVEVPGGEAWPASIRAAMHNCGTFKRVYSSSAVLTGLASDLNFVTYRAPIEIWRNEQ